MCKRRCFSPLLTSLLIGSSLAPLAASAQSAWYVGASVGQSAIKASPGEVENGFLLDDGFTASGTTLDKKDTGWKGYAGYRFNHQFYAGAYFQYGFGVVNDDRQDVCRNVNFDCSASDVRLGIMGRYHLPPFSQLSPWVGRVLAQEALGLPTDVSLAPYALERFRTGQLLNGKYGVGAVS